MGALIELVSNNALVSSLVGAVILGLVGWAGKAYRDRNDSKKIYAFLVDSKAETDYRFRSTERIASKTKLSDRRVAALCSRHPKIRRNEQEKQSWTLVE